MPLYVYAIAREAPRGGRGLSGETITAISAGSLCALVGRMENPSLSRESIEGHEAAVRRLAAKSEALLPVRFGTSFADEKSLRALLEKNEDALSRALTEVEGCEQMTVRVIAAPRGREPMPEPKSGTEYLTARSRAQKSALDIPELEPVREAVRTLIRGERIEAREGERLVTLNHLVAKGAAEAYLAALGGLSAPRLRATGPWPAWAFAPEVTP